MKNGTLILILFLGMMAFAQGGSEELKFGGRVKPDKPTVYLEYVCQNKEKVYLRMYNNTIWHISVRADKLYPSKTRIKLRNDVNTYAAPNDKEIGLYYRVEQWALPSKNVGVPRLPSPDNGFDSWIASQDSILFSVPVQYLRKDLQVFVRFAYEWEVTKDGYTINDPEHRVVFRGIDLSDTKPLACKGIIKAP